MRRNAGENARFFVPDKPWASLARAPRVKGPLTSGA